MRASTKSHCWLLEIPKELESGPWYSSLADVLESGVSGATGTLLTQFLATLSISRGSVVGLQELSGDGGMGTRWIKSYQENSLWHLEMRMDLGVTLVLQGKGFVFVHVARVAYTQNNHK